MRSHTPVWLMRLLGCLTLILMLPQAVLAHGGAPEGPQRAFTQRVGPYDLIVIVELPLTIPSSLLVDIVPQGDLIPQQVVLRVVPRGQSFEQAEVVTVDMVAGPQGVYYAQLPVDQAGAWELEVQTTGSSGVGMTRIPLMIAPTIFAPYTIELSVAVMSTMLMLIAGLIAGGIAGWRAVPTPRWLEILLHQGTFATLTASLIFGGLMWRDTVSQPSAPAVRLSAGGRPHVNVALATAPALPQAGQPMTLTLDLTDGGTGLPADDLVSHHEALMHLVILDTTGGFMNHLHPPRISPGRYAISVTPDRAGRYSAYVEIEREGSGTQVIMRDFAVEGHQPPQLPPAPGPGSRQINGMHVQITTSVETVRAGRQTTMTFSFSEGGRPVMDLQPWLGMGGHMFARSADHAIFAHIHAAEPMAPASVTGLGIRYGPSIRFVYTFPRAGSYQVWAQFQRNGGIITIPLTIEVQA